MSHIVNGGQAYDTNTWLPPSTPTAMLTEMQLSLWAIRDMVTRIGRDVELLLEERTKPAQPKKLATEETEQLFVTEGDVKNVGKYFKAKKVYMRLKGAVELIEQRIEKMGGTAIMQRKFKAGLLHCYFRVPVGHQKYAGYYGRVDFVDKTIKSKGGNYKKFGVYIKTEQEYFAIMDSLGNALGVDFRSRYA